MPVCNADAPTPGPSVTRRRVMGGLVATTASLLTAACGEGGVVPSSGVALRPLSTEFTSRKAVAYSPFRTSNRDNEVITTAQILQDLNLLIAGNYRLIRLFDSSDMVARQVLQTIRSAGLDMRVMLGIYIQSGNDAFNRAEVERGIALANEYREIVLAVSVGNETMVSWSFNPVPVSAMVAWLGTVRSRVPQPVTTDDNWALFADAPRALTDAIDFVAMHTYPLADSVHSPNKWNWKQESVPAAGRAAAMMDAALASARDDYAAVRKHLDSIGLSAMPVVIGETGWKAIATGGETRRAHPVNQKMYLDRIEAWQSSATGSARPGAIFCFEAFDEPWKNSDDGWGLFNVKRQARYAVQSLFPQANWEPGSYTAADAVYYIPVAANPIVTANRYAVYGDAIVTGEARPAETPTWNAWENGTTAFAPEVTTDSAPGDANRCIDITPRPLAWGWGLAAMLMSSADDLSNFASAGRLNFSLKTTYPGRIEVGFLTGTTTDGTAYDVYLAIASGEYGHLADGAWHQVSIPLSAIIARGAPAFGMTDPAKAKLDLTRVTVPFVIADRYGVTGKPQGSGITTRILVDAIFWSK